MAGPRARPDPLVGRVVGGCALRQKLGRGRTGNVYRARFEAVHKDVAVKVLRGDEARRPELREAFLREARAIAALDHENIVKIVDVIEEEDAVLIVMELLEGENLWERIQRGERFPPERAARIVAQVARALDAAHRQKLVHRDVKPQNVILLSRDRVKVVDFGLAALPGSGGDRVGTPHYMAPEQATRSKVDAAADVYSLGATFYHMLTGRTPYEGETVGEILKAHQEGQLRSPREVDALIPAEVDALVRQMMAPAKGYRPTAEQVVKSIEDILADIEARRRRARGGRPEAGRRASGPRAPSFAGPLIGGFLALCGVLVVVLILALKTKEQTDAREPEDAPAASRTVPVAPPERPEDPQVRHDRANEALAGVEAWMRSNPGRTAEAIERLRAVARDYANTDAGRRAGKQAGDLEMQQAPPTRREPPPPPDRKPEPPKVSLAELEGRLGAARKLLGRLEVESAEKALDELRVEAAGSRLDESVTREIEALAWVRSFRDELVRTIEASGRLSYRILKPAHPDAEASIVGADAEGLKIQGGGKTWVEAWGSLSAPEVFDLAKRLLSQTDPRLSFALGIYLVRAGQAEKARDYFDLARMFQRSGEYDGLIERLGK